MTCEYCKKAIERHGNARYCPEKNGIKDYCYKQEKKRRQKALLKAKIEKAKIENLLTGTLEGILQGKHNAFLSNLNFLERYINDAIFQEYIVNNHPVLKFKSFQLWKVIQEDNSSIFKLIKINNENEFEI